MDYRELMERQYSMSIRYESSLLDCLTTPPPVDPVELDRLADDGCPHADGGAEEESFQYDFCI